MQTIVNMSLKKIALFRSSINSTGERDNAGHMPTTAVKTEIIMLFFTYIFFSSQVITYTFSQTLPHYIFDIVFSQ